MIDGDILQRAFFRVLYDVCTVVTGVSLYNVYMGWVRQRAAKKERESA